MLQLDSKNIEFQLQIELGLNLVILFYSFTLLVYSFCIIFLYIPNIIYRKIWRMVVTFYHTWRFRIATKTKTKQMLHMRSPPVRFILDRIEIIN